MMDRIQTAAVIGSGTMGGGIAALLAGLGIPTTLLDIVPRELTQVEKEIGLTLADREVRNRIVEAGWKAVTRSRPPALLSKQSEQLITLGNLEDDLGLLAKADLIIEAIVENLGINNRSSSDLKPFGGRMRSSLPIPPAFLFQHWPKGGARGSKAT
jgi:3-hydroxyacyl-CoA dehydrogenase